MKQDTRKVLFSCLEQMSKNKQNVDTRKEYGTGIESEIMQYDGKKTIVCGITSIVCALIGFVVRIFSFIGLIFGIVSLQNGLEKNACSCWYYLFGDFYCMAFVGIFTDGGDKLNVGAYNVINLPILMVL